MTVLAGLSSSRRSLDVGRVVSLTFGALRRRWLHVALLAGAGYVAPLAALSWARFNFSWPQGSPSSIVLTIAELTLSYAGGAFVRSAVTQIVVQDFEGRRGSLTDALSTAAKSWLPVTGIRLLASLGQFVGFVLLIVPGVLLSLSLSVQVPAQVIERRGVFASMRRSFHLTLGRRGSILALGLGNLVLVFIVALAVRACFGVPLIAHSDTTTTAGLLRAVTGANNSLTLPGALATAVSATVYMTISAVGVTALYYELRKLKEGIGPEALASVFD